MYRDGVDVFCGMSHGICRATEELKSRERYRNHAISTSSLIASDTPNS